MLEQFPVGEMEDVPKKEEKKIKKKAAIRTVTYIVI